MNDENLKWINAREANMVPRIYREPKVDERVSVLVGRPIMATDPRLLRYVVEWKKSHPNPNDELENNFENPDFLVGLKNALNA